MEIQGKYVKNMRKYKGTIIVLIVCMIFAYLYAHVDKKEYFYNRTVDVGKYSNTGVICEKKLTQDVYSTEKSLDGIQVKTHNYVEWVLYAGIVFFISSVITIVVNYVLDRNGTKGAIRMLVRK